MRDWLLRAGIPPLVRRRRKSCRGALRVAGYDRRQGRRPRRRLVQILRVCADGHNCGRRARAARIHPSVWRSTLAAYALPRRVHADGLAVQRLAPQVVARDNVDDFVARAAGPGAAALVRPVWEFTAALRGSPSGRPNACGSRSRNSIAKLGVLVTIDFNTSGCEHDGETLVYTTLYPAKRRLLDMHQHARATQRWAVFPKGRDALTCHEVSLRKRYAHHAAHVTH